MNGLSIKTVGRFKSVANLRTLMIRNKSKKKHCQSKHSKLFHKTCEFDITRLKAQSELKYSNKFAIPSIISNTQDIRLHNFGLKQSLGCKQIRKDWTINYKVIFSCSSNLNTYSLR